MTMALVALAGALCCLAYLVVALTHRVYKMELVIAAQLGGGMKRYEKYRDDVFDQTHP